MVTWPVKNFIVLILGALSEMALLSLFAALRRDGARMVMGEDLSGKIHIVGGRNG